MRLVGLTWLLWAIAASLVVGNSIEARSPFENVRRQMPTTICTTECSTFQNSLDVCTTTTCLCTKAVDLALNDCVNCYYQDSPSTAVLNSANTLVNAFENACAGFTTLPPIFVTITSSGGGTTVVTVTATVSVLPTTPPATIAPPTIVRTLTGPVPTTTLPSAGGLPGLNGAASAISAGIYPAFAVTAVLSFVVALAF